MRDWGPHCFANSDVQKGQSLTQFSYQKPQGIRKVPAFPVSIPLRDVPQTSVRIVAFKTSFVFVFHKESPYGSHYSVGPEAICANTPPLKSGPKSHYFPVREPLHLIRKHVYLFGLWPAGRLRHGYISNIQAGVPPRNQFVPEGERARSKQREWTRWNDFEGKCLSVSRRPFPPGDRVTFNGRDCLCQLCAQPMSSSPNEASCSSSKCTATTTRNTFVIQRWLRKMPSFGKVLFASTKCSPI